MNKEISHRTERWLALGTSLLIGGAAIAGDVADTAPAEKPEVLVLARANGATKKAQEVTETRKEIDAALENALQNLAHDNRLDLETRLLGHNLEDMVARN